MSRFFGAIESLYRRLGDHKFGRNVAVLTGGTIAGRAITVLAAPLLSRLYTPADFGVLSVFFSTVAALVLVCAFNYEAAIPLPKEDDLGLGLTLVSFSLLGANTVICALAVVLFGGPLARLLGSPQLQPYLWLLPVGLFGGGAFFILNSWAIRVQAFASIAQRRVSQSLFQAMIQLAWPALKHGPMGLLLGDCLGRAGGTWPLARAARHYVKEHKLRFSLGSAMQAAARYKRFPLVGLLSVVVHASVSLLPAPLLTRYFGLQEAGWFGLVYQVLGVAIGLIGLGVAQVYLGESVKLAHSSPSALRTLFLKTSKAMALAGLLPLAVVALLGPQLFSLVFGAKWTEAGRYAQILTLPFLVLLAVGPVFNTLTVLEHQDWQIGADAVGVFIMLPGVWYVHQLGLSGRWAVAVCGVAIVVTYLMLFSLALYAIQRRCSQEPVEPGSVQ